MEYTHKMQLTYQDNNESIYMTRAFESRDMGMKAFESIKEMYCQVRREEIILERTQTYKQSGDLVYELKTKDIYCQISLRPIQKQEDDNK